jgi:lysyl-tRNA synthetase class 2
MTDTTLYYKERLEHIYKLKNENINPYPYSYTVTKSLDDFTKTYFNIETGSHFENIYESLAGRCIEIRPAGKLTFITVSSNTTFLQFMIKQDILENKDDYKNVVSKIHRGDIIGAFGFVGKSKKAN